MILPKCLYNQKGFAHLLLLIASLGALAFLVIASSAKFKDEIFSRLYIRPPSRAAESFYGKNVEVLKLFGQKKITETSRNLVTNNKVYHSVGVTVDKSSSPNKVYVVDTGNNRILGFDGINDEAGADIVIGQVDFESATCNRDNNVGYLNKPGPASLCYTGHPYPTNVAERWGGVNIDVDSLGNVYVPDGQNNRVLKYNQPFSSDKTGGKGDSVADFVWGQDDFDGNGRNRGSYFGDNNPPDNHSLWISFGPPDGASSIGVSVDPQNNVWVADTFNNRILRFPPNSKNADLVLGQDNFTSKGCIENGPLNKFCLPTLAKVNPETGDLYVIDEYPRGFNGRIMIFKAPFSNGMSAAKIIKPQNAGMGSDTYEFKEPTGLVFNTYKVGDYAPGVFWVADKWRRYLLLDDEGQVIKVIGAKDKNSGGGDGAYQGCQNIYDPNKFYLFTPRGSFGIDSANNIYIADDFHQRVSRYSLPYNLQTLNGNTCLPEPNGGLFKSFGVNKPSMASLGEAVGLTIFNNQLIVQDEGGFKVWNDYLTKPEIGSAADFMVTGNNLVGNRRLFSQAIDDLGHLWFGNEHGALRVDQLPYKGGDVPLANFVKLYWQDDGSEVDYYGGITSVAFDKKNKKLYLADSRRSRILRISNYGDLTGKLIVDKVIGQSDKNSTACNHGSPNPVVDGFCGISQIKFDNFGNLYVVENSYECHGNQRVTVLLESDLNAAGGLYSLIAANKVFNANSFTEKGACAYWTVDKPGSPVSLAFDSKNHLIIGNDGYYGNNELRHLRQLWFYPDPLNRQTPDAYIDLPMGAPGEMIFDGQDNLIIQDHTWARVWMINLNTDPVWLKYLPGITPLPTGLSTPSPTPILTPSPTPSPSVSPRPICNPLKYNKKTWFNEGTVCIADRTGYKAQKWSCLDKVIYKSIKKDKTCGNVIRSFSQSEIDQSNSD